MPGVAGLVLALHTGTLVAQPSPAVAAAPTDHAAVIAELRRWVRDTMEQLGAPGATIAVIHEGRIVWSEGFGMADLENGVPATPDTRFRIGSVSKALTSVAIGRLVEQGRLDLDAPVQRYVPTFPQKRWPITVRQVAGHLAGIRHYRGNEFASMAPYPTVEAGLAIFADDSLLFEPGTRYLYSSYGWNLISAVIEGASGQPFLQYMQREVLARPELQGLVPEYPDSIIPHRARFYTRGPDGGGILNAPYVDNSYKWAGGGYLGTSESLAWFGELMLRGALVADSTRAVLWTSQQRSSGQPTGYGIGWVIGTDSAGRPRVGHGGGSMGGTANLTIFPGHRLVVAVLVNSDATFVGAAPWIGGRFLDDRDPTPSTPTRP